MTLLLQNRSTPRNETRLPAGFRTLSCVSPVPGADAAHGLFSGQSRTSDMSRVIAQRIYQENLDAVFRALMDGDLNQMLDHIAIPNMIATRDSQIVMSSHEEVDMVMQDFRSHLISRGVTEYHRVCIEADFVAGRRDMIAGRHETTARGADGVLITPYTSHMVLMTIGGRWQLIWLQAVMDNTELQMLSPDIAEAQAEAHRILETSGQDQSRTPMTHRRKRAT
jgi:hypothetical protein